MNDVRKRQVLEYRLAGLRGHIETVGPSLAFERELAKAEKELQLLDEPQK